ncbi:Hexosyltransferase [Aphelenchoides besseyi]|nr:Hexosyltransferase [Aphelenchoides besseyi]KAI6210552.1 Hexosyltransferase [Aphelenchoides besseyi]
MAAVHRCQRAGFSVARELLGQPSEYLYCNDWAEVQTLITPTCKKNWLTRRKSLLIIVKSAPERVERRMAYRKTLGNVKQVGSFRLRTIFVMGMSSKWLQFKGSQLEDEAIRFQDMLVGDFHDNYFNNTLKYLNSMKWARWHCFPGSSLIPYLVLMDDDYMLNVTGLISLLDRTTPNEQLYTGYRFDTTPFRLIFQKFRLSIEEYPYNAFPPYCSGGFVLYSPQAVREFYAAIQHLRTFRFDDVYAGIVAHYLGYEVLMNRNFLFKRDDSIPWTTKIAEHDWTAKEIENAFASINTVKR